MALTIHKNLTKCRLTFVRIFSTTDQDRLNKILANDAPNLDKTSAPDDIAKTARKRKARSIKVVQHFTNEPHLNDLKDYIPSKYFHPKRRLLPQHLYLVDKQIAKDVASRMIPFLRQNKKQIVSETNPGLGLITSELLNGGVKFVRLYETCPEFRQLLKKFNTAYPNRVELFVKDFFYLGALSTIDKHDGGDRVEQLLGGIPKRSWEDDPVMTIVGPMPSLDFINYLFRMLAMQQGIVTYGRIQIFALMRPMDYIKITARPGMSLHVYQIVSVLFQMFFECQLLEKYNRKSFLPWETKAKDNSRVHLHTKVDLNYLYLVRINLKKTIPTDPKNLLHLYYFIKQGFLKGRPKVIPTVEKWLPGIGVNLIAPRSKFKDQSFPNMNIYTEFGELNSTQILHIFLEMLENPEYKNSPFVALVESQLLKNETIESDLVKKTNIHIENLQENLS